MRMRKKKWARPELSACPFFVEKPEQLKGKWNTFFGNGLPLYLDLGCGKCVFLAEAANKNRSANFVGIDISFDILGVGRRNIVSVFGEERPENVAIMSYNIERLSELFAPEDKVERLYINFCNPWPSARCHKRRLTHTRQLEGYKSFLKDGAEIWFKTDNDDLYLATKRYFNEAGFEIFFDTTDLTINNDPENILTEHEIRFTSEGINTKAIKAKYHAEKILDGRRI